MGSSSVRSVRGSVHRNLCHLLQHKWHLRGWVSAQIADTETHTNPGFKGVCICDSYPHRSGFGVAVSTS